MSAKPSPPKLNRDGLKEFRSSTDDKAELIALASRFETYQTSLKTHELTTTFIAFEALAAFCGGRLEGYSDEDLQTTWPKGWGSDAAKVPFTLLMALSRAWMKYQTSPKAAKPVRRVFNVACTRLQPPQAHFTRFWQSAAFGISTKALRIFR